MRVAVIGAGIAGISCASELQQAGYEVVLFDKARSVGGRMSSKRTVHGYMDFGAQYFTARHPLFQQQVTRWQQQGVVSRWLAPIYQYQQHNLSASPDEQQRFIGVPAMHSPLKWQAKRLQNYVSCRIVALQSVANLWHLVAEQGESYGPFAHVVIAIPPAQAASILPPANQVPLPESLLQPCWAVTLVLARASGHPAGGIFIKDTDSNLSWVSRHNSKPGRAQAESWLLHFSPAFSALHLEQDTVFWRETAEQALAKLLTQPIQVVDAVAHRWLYAQINEKAASGGIEGAIGQGLWLAGDWTRGGRVENAWLSGYDIAIKIREKRSVQYD